MDESPERVGRKQSVRVDRWRGMESRGLRGMEGGQG